MKHIISAILIVAIAYGAMAQNVLTPELLWQLKRVGGPSVSPDQSKFVYGVSTYKLEENKGSNLVYVQDIETGTRTQLTDVKGWESNVRWHPSGKKIGFISSGQLWEVNIDGKNLKQISFIENGIGGFEYAPNGQFIFYLQDVVLDKKVNELYTDLPMADARIIDDLLYRHWDDWHDYAYSHIFFSAYSDSIISGTDIMKGERFDSPLKPFGGIDEITWSSDSKTIAYTCKKLNGKEYAESTNSAIYLYDLIDGATTNLTKGMMGYDKHPTYSPDGKYIAWESMRTPGFEADKNEIFLYNFETKEKKFLLKGIDQTAGGIVWSKDSKSIYFSSGVQATSQIFNINVVKGNRSLTQLTKGDYNYGSFSVAGDALIIARQDMNHATELYKVNMKNGDAEVITHENDDIYSSITTGKVEKRWVKTTDNKEMLVWVIYPPNFNPEKKYPTLLYCQGGPQAAVSQFYSFRWNFQLMAANDYIIVAPNRRGLPSFGQEWNDAISKDWGGQAMKDYLSAIDAVKKEPYVDEDNIGAVGASYGGYSVYYLAGIHENRFKAFISHCGLFNLESWYGTTEELFFANYDNKGPYWKEENKAYYEKNSPHKFVRNWTSPMLVIHGEKDFRVPVGEGLQAFQAAQIQGIPSRFLYFPEESHWVLSPQNGVLWHRVFFDWLDKWLKNSTDRQ